MILIGRGLELPYSSLLEFHRLFTSFVRFSMSILWCSYIVGIFNDEGPPVPIPNTEVKLICAEDTWLEAAWKNMSMPTLILFRIQKNDMFFDKRKQNSW